MALAEILGLGFLQRALAAGLLIAVSCALLSPYIVLRRMAFAGHGLSHAAFGGAAIALVAGLPIPIGAVAFSLLLSVVLAIWTRRRAVTEDSAIGIAVAASMALGVVALALRRRYTQDVMSFLFGNILAVRGEDLLFTAAVAATTAVLLLRHGRALQSATFHEEIARVEGVPVDRLRILLFLLTAVNVVAAMKLVGAILVSALVIVPGALGLRGRGRFAGAQLLAVASGVLSVTVGLALSYLLDLPSGAVIALVLFGAYAAAHLLPTPAEGGRAHS